jgi:hypothetical protein
MKLDEMKQKSEKTREEYKRNKITINIFARLITVFGATVNSKMIFL